MQNNSPSTLLAKVTPRRSSLNSLASTTLRSGLILLGLSALGGFAYADTISKYHQVMDTVQSGATPTGIPGIFSLRSVLDDVTSTGTSVTYTVWDSNGASSPTPHYVGVSSFGQVSPYGQQGASQTEQQFTTTVPAPPGSQTIGVYAGANPFGGGSSPYINLRNFRVRYGSVSTVDCPTLTYDPANIVDGGTYSALPTTFDVNNPLISDVGFRGYATPYQSSNAVTAVYMSLQQPNGQYWDGTGWGHLRVNHQAGRKVINASTQQIEWSKIGNWPTGSLLPSGVYTLRTMAKIGVSAGRGTLNTISFTIDTITPNPAQLTSPTQGTPVALLSSLGGTCSDNTGGSGVSTVKVAFTFEGVNGGKFDWDWVNQNWVPINTSGANGLKLATVSGGNSWSINSGLPPASKQYGGLYTVRMYTKDVAGNPESYGTGGVSIFQDAAIVTTPSNNSTVSSLPVISGTSDPGTLDLGLVLSRKQNTANFTQSWNWVTQTWVPLNSSPNIYTYIFPSNGLWSLTANLPSGASLQNDSYNIATFSNDRSGVQKIYDGRFTVSKGFGAKQQTPSGGGS